MTKYYVSKVNNPIVHQAKRIGISQKTILRALNITDFTYTKYLTNPFIIPLGHLMILSSLFNLTIHEFIHLLIIDKPQLKKDDKWYLESIKDGEK